MSNNILFELKQQLQSSQKQGAPLNLNLKQSGSQSSRAPIPSSNKSIKMIKKSNNELN